MRAGVMGSPRALGSVSAASLPSLPQSPPQSRPNSASGPTSAPVNPTGTTSIVIVARNMLPALAPMRPAGLGISHTPLSHTQLSQSPTAPIATSHVGGESAATPQAQSQPPQQPVQGNSGPLAQTEVPASATPVATQVGQDYFNTPIRRPSVSKGGAGATPVPAPAPVPVPTTLDESGPATAAGAGANAGTESNDAAVGNGSATPGTPGGGLIGKLRGLGRATKRAQNEGSAPGTPGPVVRTPGPTATGGVAGAGSASSTVVAAATPATSTTTTSSGTPVCFPVYIAIENSRVDPHNYITGSARTPRETAHGGSTCPHHWHAQPADDRGWSYAPACTRHSAAHRGGARAWMGDPLPWHCRECGNYV